MGIGLLSWNFLFFYIEQQGDCLAEFLDGLWKCGHVKREMIATKFIWPSILPWDKCVIQFEVDVEFDTRITHKIT